MKLTNTRVKALVPEEGKQQQFHWDSEIRGFGVRVSNTGAKNYVFQGRVNGKVCRMTLGKSELLSCDEARRRAIVKLLAMADGIDPREEVKKNQIYKETLRECKNDYLENKRTKHGELRPRSKKNIEVSFANAFLDWLDNPMVDITRDACLVRYRERSVKSPAQANQDFRHLRGLINWFREKSVDADGVYTVFPTNPVSQMFKGRQLAQWNNVIPRTTRIPQSKLIDVWLLLQNKSSLELNLRATAISADLLMFLLLTGVRIGEATGLQWRDINLSADIPTFHLSFTKNHNAVTLPISRALLVVLKRRHRDRTKGNDFVFPSVSKLKAPMSDPRSLLKKISKIAGVHIHPHALRRTFDDIAQVCGVDADQRRQLLNHLATDTHGLAYANNPDPSALNDAVNRVGDWCTSR